MFRILQPDSAAGLGMVQAGAFLRLMYACERFVYRGAAGVSGISSGMIDAFAAKGVPPGKVFLLPNWLHSSGDIQTLMMRTVLRFAEREHDISPEALLAVYSGNLGRKQGLEVLLDACRNPDRGQSVKGRSVVLIIAGDGAGKEVPPPAASTKRTAQPAIAATPVAYREKYQIMLRAAKMVAPRHPTAGHRDRYVFPSKLLNTRPQCGFCR